MTRIEANAKADAEDFTATAPVQHQDATALPEASVGDDAAITIGDVDALMAVAATVWPGHDFAAVQVSVADVEGVGLAATSGTTITIDPLAAGWGWHTSTAPPPADRMDLLTVLADELGSRDR